VPRDASLGAAIQQAENIIDEGHKLLFSYATRLVLLFVAISPAGHSELKLTSLVPFISPDMYHVALNA